MSPSNPSAKGRTRLILWGGLAVLLVALSVWLYSVISKPSEPIKRRTVQEISLLKPPPPPPPPPPKTPPPPPPPQQKIEKIDVPKPQATPPEQPSQAPPPGPNLGVDAAGSGTGDGFGLVGKPGGNELIGGGGGGGKGDPFAWYGALVKERITEAIFKDKKLKAASEFQRNVNVWVSASGAITRVELVGQSQSAELDDALRVALRTAAPVRDGAPGGMPQPIRLRISTRS